VQNLLGFRLVDKRAMDLVASLTEWQKVCQKRDNKQTIANDQKIMKRAPHTICLPIGLNILDTFTLPALVSALRHSTCPLKPYKPHKRTDPPATHINMINLTRLCTDYATNGSIDYIHGCSGFSSALWAHRMRSMKHRSQMVLMEPLPYTNGRKSQNTQRRTPTCVS
jgi:hypothetical protein